MTSRTIWLNSKIASQGYCCLYGYLALCRERGETVKNMAKNIGISQDALWYHYRKFDYGAKPPKCQRVQECLDDVIQELVLENRLEKKPPE